jgi:sec-independent protein translocase protein TatA
MGGLSPWHWAIVAIVIVVMFGANRLPEAARSLGKSMRIFKSEVRELHDDDEILVTPVPAAADPFQSRRGESTAGHSDARTV